MLAAGVVALFVSSMSFAGVPGADPCIVPEDSTGSVSLPPEGCAYLSPTEVHMIIDGLPAGTEIMWTSVGLRYAHPSGGRLVTWCGLIPGSC